jgi:hypothetical protein
MKWKDSSAHHRANIAWALITIMPAMLASDRGKPDEKEMRAASRQWGFNAKHRARPATPRRPMAVPQRMAAGMRPTGFGTYSAQPAAVSREPS